MARVKIVLDADVVIDFMDGKRLCDLPKILPAYDFVLLDIVMREELSKWPPTSKYITKSIEWVSNGPKLSIIEWHPDNQAKQIYAHLRQSKGIGESACMAYCQTNNDVLASCNLRDTKKYCEENGITYLTFLDLVWYAWKNKVMSEEECNQCIQYAIAAKNKIPNIRTISEYLPTISNL